MPSFFKEAHNMNFSGNQSFTDARTINNIHNYSQSGSALLTLKEQSSFFTEPGGEEKQLIMVAKSRGFKQIDIGDIIVEREVSSEVFDVKIRPPPGRVLKTTNPFRERVTRNYQTPTSVKIRRRVQIAEIIQFRDRKFTMVTFEPENETDTEKMELLWKQIFEVSSSQRRECLPQLFGLGRASTPRTLIYHDAFLVGDAVYTQFRETPVVWSYLYYTFASSYLAMATDDDMKTLMRQVTNVDHREWVFNLRNCSWQYDIDRAILSIPAICESLSYGNRRRLTSYLTNQHNNNLSLKSNVIVNHLQQGFLRLIDSLGVTAPFGSIVKNFACHDLLTFGAIIDPIKTILPAHFLSIPAPEWYMYFTNGHGFTTCPLQTAPNCIHLVFDKSMDVIQLDLEFGLKIPPHEREQFRTAYLTQSLGLFKNFSYPIHTWGKLLFLDQFCFSVTGTLTSDFLHHSLAQVHLFIPIISTEWINDMPCLHWPSNTPFFWSSDPEGMTPIPEEDWQHFGIPKLEVQTYLGTSWDQEAYESILEYLKMQKCDPYSDQYAREQGFEIMAQWDPHTDNQVQQDNDDWVGIEQNNRSNLITSPSTYSLISQSDIQLIQDDIAVLDEAIDNRSGESFLSWLSKGWMNPGRRSKPLGKMTADKFQENVAVENEGENSDK